MGLHAPKPGKRPGKSRETQKTDEQEAGSGGKAVLPTPEEKPELEISFKSQRAKNQMGLRAPPWGAWKGC